MRSGFKMVEFGTMCSDDFFTTVSRGIHRLPRFIKGNAWRAMGKGGSPAGYRTKFWMFIDR